MKINQEVKITAGDFQGCEGKVVNLENELVTVKLDKPKYGKTIVEISIKFLISLLLLFSSVQAQTIWVKGDLKVKAGASEFNCDSLKTTGVICECYVTLIESPSTIKLSKIIFPVNELKSVKKDEEVYINDVDDLDR